MGFFKSISKIIGNANESVLNTVGQKQEKINRLQDSYRSKSDKELKLIYENHKSGVRPLSFEESMAFKQEMKDRDLLS